MSIRPPAPSPIGRFHRSEACLCHNGVCGDGRVKAYSQVSRSRSSERAPWVKPALLAERRGDYLIQRRKAPVYRAFVNSGGRI